VRVALCPAPWRGRRVLAALAATYDGAEGRTAAHDHATALLKRALSFEGAVHLVSTGTEALVMALTAIGASAGDEVVVSTFNCPSVVDAILEAQLVPVLCDVREDGTPGAAEIRQKLSARTVAVLMTHVLGAVCDVAEIATLCRERGLTLIDDAAQVFGRAPSTAQLGTCGDLGVLSFGRHKPIYAGGGGALLVRDVQRYPALLRLRNVPDDRARAVRSLLRPLAHDRAQRIASGLVVRHRFKDVAEALTARRFAFEGASMSASEAMVLAGELREHGTRRWRVRSHHERYRRGFAGSRLITARGFEPGVAASFHTVLVPPLVRHELATRLARAGVETTWLYYPLHRVPQYARFASGQYPGAEWLWPRTLCLPCRSSHTAEDIDHVVRAFVRSAAEVDRQDSRAWGTFQRGLVG
jgi:dTDP-4-amino-4,6-dideoxygalactose transaminase